jgi:beta-aspartyl-dipeptidase (metallo-type)
VPAFLEDGEVKPSAGLRRMLDAGVSPDHITFTSDGQGSLPLFDAHGKLQGLGVGRVTSLLGEVRDAVRDEHVPLGTALQTITSNPARILKLHGKGRLAAGADADIVLLDPGTLDVRGVLARGAWLMKDGAAQKRGTFE